MKTYSHPSYQPTSPQAGHDPRRWPVVVVGAGPVGITAAVDLAQRGINVLLLDEDTTVSTGSRAICWAKRTLEIFDRLGCGDRLIEKGISWNVGRVFFRDEQIYDFNLLAETGHRRPAFINLQQYWVEQFLVERAQALPHATLRWGNRVVGVSCGADGATLRVSAGSGEYTVDADWLIVADGAKSAIRRSLGLESEGQVFRDRFLIADIHMTSGFPTERWFWFDPPFHRHQSALLHRQADDVWRVDFQLGWDADPEEEKKPENIAPRLRAMLGAEAQFEIEWASVYSFQCRRMRAFRHGRALFVGDAAHVVSPFGARGANSGIQDVDNLAWKLQLVIAGRAPSTLLDTYDDERRAAADENIRHSTRSTDFITPKSAISRTFRDAVLSLAKRHPFARRLVNSGRLSAPATLLDSTLNTADQPEDGFGTSMRPGTPAADAPVAGPLGPWLLPYLSGGFVLLLFDDSLPAGAIAELAPDRGVARNAGGDSVLDLPACAILRVGRRADDEAGVLTLADAQGLLAQRYDARRGTCYLFRPDQHVCARWRRFDPVRIREALRRAVGCDANVAMEVA